MSQFAEIKDLWMGHQSSPFPKELAKEDFGDHCAVTIDSAAAGCISEYVTNGTIDENRLKILESCIHDLDSMIPLVSNDSKDYLTRLKEIGIKIITESRKKRNYT